MGVEIWMWVLLAGMVVAVLSLIAVLVTAVIRAERETKSLKEQLHLARIGKNKAV